MALVLKLQVLQGVVALCLCHAGKIDLGSLAAGVVGVALTIIEGTLLAAELQLQFLSLTLNRLQDAVG